MLVLVFFKVGYLEEFVLVFCTYEMISFNTVASVLLTFFGILR